MKTWCCVNSRRQSSCRAVVIFSCNRSVVYSLSREAAFGSPEVNLDHNSGPTCLIERFLYALYCSLLYPRMMTIEVRMTWVSGCIFILSFLLSVTCGLARQISLGSLQGSEWPNIFETLRWSFTNFLRFHRLNFSKSCISINMLVTMR